MVIKSIHLQHFKSHTDTFIEFDQITSIVGLNSHGKSNILKALKLVLQHENWPTDWIQQGETKSTVTVTFSDGLVVKRERTLSSQSVEITKDGVTTSFTGKKDAKTYIEEATGIKKIILDSSSGPEDLNFIGVFDGPCIVGSRSDVVLRKIAGLIGLNAIDDAKTKLSKKLKDIQSSYEFISQEIKPLEIDTETFNFATKTLNEKLNSCKEVQNNRDNSKDQLAKLFRINEHYISLVSKLKTIEEASMLHEKLSSIEKITNQIESAKILVSKLKTLNILTSSSKDLQLSNTAFHNLIFKWEKCSHLKATLDRYLILLEDYSKILQTSKENKQKINELNESLKKLLAEKEALESLGLLCPTCGSTLDE